MPSSRPIEERFAEKVNQNGPIRRPELGPCFVWTGARFRNGGYGAISYRLRPVRAHRLAWFLAVGVWPKKKILHRCDNPSCVRVEHLFEGTQGENMADKVSKGRARGGKPFAKITQEIADDIRARCKRGERVVDVAADVGIAASAISAIKNGYRWVRREELR